MTAILSSTLQQLKKKSILLYSTLLLAPTQNCPYHYLLPAATTVTYACQHFYLDPSQADPLQPHCVTLSRSHELALLLADRHVPCFCLIHAATFFHSLTLTLNSRLNMADSSATFPPLPVCPIPYEVDAGGVPVFSPSTAQFDDFHSFIHAVYAVGSQSGIIRVIPPSSYVPNASHYANVGSDLQVHTPVYQQVQGAAGMYQMLPIERDSMTVRQFVHECMKVERARSAREKQLAVESDYAALEQAYWKNIGHSQPCYGADSPGSLFDCGVAWNMDRLHTLLDLVPADIGGVTRPMLYFGQWKASFCVHVEDMNLSSINYIHAGHPKQWYALAPADHGKFEQLASSLYQQLHSKCREFLRHKHVLLKPSKLRERGLVVRQTVQREGEFIVTWPCSYHQGYNLGFNVAESVNFATEEWIEWGEQADVCQCRKHSVKIDVGEFKRKVERVNAAQAELEGDERKVQQARRPLSMSLIRAEPRLMEALVAAGHTSAMASGQRSMTGLIHTKPTPPSPTNSTSSSTSSVSSVTSLSALSDTAIPAELLHEGGADDESDDEDGVTYEEEFIPEKGVNMHLQCGYPECAGRTFRNVGMLSKHWQSHIQPAASAHSAKRRGQSRTVSDKRRRLNDDGEDDEDDRDDKSFRSSGGARAAMSTTTRSGRKRTQQVEDEDREEAEDDGVQLSMLELLAMRGDMLGLSTRWKARAALKQTQPTECPSGEPYQPQDAVQRPEQHEEEHAEEQPNEDEAEEDVHVVESITKHRRQKGQVQFWVKWEDGPQPTWEPLDNVQHLLDEMYPSYRSATKRKR